MLLQALLNSLEPQAAAEQSEAGAEETIRYIEWLMHWYCRSPSLLMAEIIVSRLESLRVLQRSGELNDPDWVCQRLLRNWEYIAQRRRLKSSPST